MKNIDLINLECSPYNESMSLVYIEPEDKYVVFHTQDGVKDVLVQCKGKHAHSACYEFFIKHYNLIKHTLYPNMPFPYSKLEEYKTHNYKVLEEIEKKHEHVTDDYYRVRICAEEYTKAVKDGIAK